MKIDIHTMLTLASQISLVENASANIAMEPTSSKRMLKPWNTLT